MPAHRVTRLNNARATREEILRVTAQSVDSALNGGTFWFIFIGHGAPATDGKDGLLVGADARQTANSLETRSVRRSELVGIAERGSHRRSILLLDACFSGRDHATGSRLVAGLQPLIAIPEATLPRATFLLTAARNNEFAGPLPGSDRPAFSYLVLGAMRGWADRDHNGRITLDEVGFYTQEVLHKLLAGARRQTPQWYPVTARDVLAVHATERGPDITGIARTLRMQAMTKRKPAQARATVRGSSPGGGRCPAGTQWRGGLCRAVIIDTTCPAGMSFVAGRGCMAAGRDARGGGSGASVVPCDSAENCHRRANAAWWGDGRRRDLRAAARLYHRACNFGEGSDCAFLGIQYITGRHFRRDLGRALAYFRQGCKHGRAVSCTNLGAIYGQGKLVKRDCRRAAGFLYKGCVLRDRAACWKLGDAYVEGRGVPVNPGRAATYYRMACYRVSLDKHAQRACQRLDALCKRHRYRSCP